MFGVGFRCRFTISLFILFLVKFRLLSCHLLGKSCSLGLPYDFFVFCQIKRVFVISRFGFEGMIWVLIAPVPGHFILVTLKSRHMYLIKQNNCI